MLSENYLHPNGQIPAYEWNFGDVNPPVHPWATIFTYRLEKARTGKGDIEWLERSFQKLLLNFTWWVNRKDRSGKNAFEGGFLGLDNIGVFDRSSPLPTGGYLEQADGTAWMALFSLNMLEIAVELAMHDPDLRGHGAQVRPAFRLDCLGHDPRGRQHRHVGRRRRILLRRAAVAGRPGPAFEGSLHGGAAAPLCGRRFSKVSFEKYPDIRERLQRFLEARPELTTFIHDPAKAGVAGRRLGAILDETKLRRVLAKMLDENEFLSPYGIRVALALPRRTSLRASTSAARNTASPYVPGESDTGMFGGNSNWRGPIWMPVNALIIRALLQYYAYYGNDFTVECPDRLRPADEPLSSRRGNLAPPRQHVPQGRKDGRRPVNGGERRSSRKTRTGATIFQFYEYFHGDNGAGLGASHQTGWTGIIARPTASSFAPATVAEVRRKTTSRRRVGSAAGVGS